mmetsp:Transcript_18046/g.41481  ORF Transcript_18046/g.41481 Transcript_18046/m.41481 type:complete len:457 (+) Transcript_18046:697-2067(+)
MPLARLAAALRRAELGGAAFVRLAERHFRQQQHADRILLVGEAIVGRLRRAIGEVQALAEHVACGGGLRRRDAQALRKNTTPVAEARAMPQQLPVPNVSKRLSFALALHLKCLHELQLVRRVSRSVRVRQVLREQIVQLAPLLHRHQGGAELRVARVDGVYVRADLARVEHTRRHLDLAERLDQLELLLEHRGAADRRQLRAAHLVGDERVEGVGQPHHLRPAAHPAARAAAAAAALARGGEGGATRALHVGDAQVVRQLVQRGVRLHDDLFLQRAERQPLRVEADLAHARLHHLQVGDHADEVEDALVQLRLRRRPGAAARRERRGRVVAVVAGEQRVLARLSLEVPRDGRRPRVLGLVAKLLVEVGARLRQRHGPAQSGLTVALLADPPPAVPRVVLVRAVVRLEHLDDVVLVVVVRDVRLVEQRVVHASPRLVKHVRLRRHGARAIHRRLPFD